MQEKLRTWDITSRPAPWGNYAYFGQIFVVKKIKIFRLTGLLYVQVQHRISYMKSPRDIREVDSCSWYQRQEVKLWNSQTCNEPLGWHHHAGQCIDLIWFFEMAVLLATGHCCSSKTVMICCCSLVANLTYLHRLLIGAASTLARLRQSASTLLFMYNYMDHNKRPC